MGRRGILTICMSCAVLATMTAGLPQPQRSIQLGGEGPRPVALGGGPIYQQQLSFGPQPGLAPQQFNPGPIPQQQQQGRFRLAPTSPQPGLQPILLSSQPASPVPLNQGRPTFSFQGFQQGPSQAPSRQQAPLRSPLATASAPQDDDEYEDEEYEEENAAQAAPSPRPQILGSPLSLRPASPAPIQRGQPQRILISQQAPQPGPGPQRFIVPQQQAIQPQPTPQQIRRPVQQRVISAAPAAPAPQQILRQQAAPQPQQSRQNSLGSDARLKNRASTPPPVQTLNRFMRNNPDGSMTWGYENEDGTFKEETLGIDCVVRGKYGYVDPDGNKREYEYQQGNPCDPNKKDQPEEDEEEEVIGGPPPREKLGSGGRPGPQLQRRPLQQVYQGQ